MSKDQFARQAFGARLRELRMSADLSGVALAVLAGWSGARVTRYELGQRLPSRSDLHIWCRLTDSEDDFSDLLAYSQNIDTAYMEWRRMKSRNVQERTGQIEAAAEMIRGYDPTLIPGLLQTTEYATAVLRTCLEFVESGESVEAAVEARMNRQNAVRQGRARMHFIIAEQTLYTAVGGNAVLEGQLEHLLTCTNSTRVTIGLIPKDAVFPGPAPDFLMFDQVEVALETASAGLAIRQPGEISLYERIFERLAAQSVVGDPARALIWNAMVHVRKKGTEQAV
ncbi:helix-turn-helix domain-containing protein [Nocardia sp. NPDC058666]|uniref:helix-turn-helix domain-containing protein n=1 Tax=unclassified Nocardia TaxID=2637762 RepID=UPI00365B5953